MEPKTNEKKSLPLYTVDSFTSEPFSGNPAAVCMDDTSEGLSEELMQTIAAEMNISETAFVRPENAGELFSEAGHLRLRWFTPTKEVPLCGHATLATAAALFYCANNQQKELIFETLSGQLVARRAEDYISLDLPLNPPQPFKDYDGVKELLKVLLPGMDDAVEELQYSTTTRKLLVRLRDRYQRSDLEKLKPLTGEFMKTHNTGHIAGVAVTLRGTADNGSVNKDGRQYDFVSRYFAPWIGIPEDPVTGNTRYCLWRTQIPLCFHLYYVTMAAKKGITRRYSLAEAVELVQDSDEFGNESSDEFCSSGSDSSNTSDSENEISKVPKRKKPTQYDNASVQFEIDIPRPSSSANATPHIQAGGMVTAQESDSDEEAESSQEIVPVVAAARAPVFVWRLPNMIEPVLPRFTARPGVLIDTSMFTTPVDYFRYFIDDLILDHMVDHTNQYANDFLRNNPELSRHSPAHLWEDRPVNRGEMLRFLGVTLLMGLVKKPQYSEYWSTNPIMATPVFSCIMPRTRYLNILRFWHFSDSARQPPQIDPNRDRMYKIRPLISHLSDKFEAALQPEQELALDESLLLYKGRLHFKQYLPKKRARFGIKIYSLCESQTGYTLKFHIYGGKEAPTFDITRQVPNFAGSTKTDQLTVYMCLPILDMGYHLYVDNWYTSLNLFKYLASRNTRACGTIRKNRIPPIVRNSLVAVGEATARRSGQILAVKFRPKKTKTVFLLSTIHNEETRVVRVRGRRPVNIHKPVAVISYNKHMGGVDKVDQLIQPYDATRKTLKWYRKVAIHLLQVSMVNAYIVFKKSEEGSMTFLKFQQKVIASLLFEADGFSEQVELHEQEDLIRLTGKHFPSTIPSTDNKARAQKRCRVCTRTGVRRDTRYHCADCPSKPGLCIEPCFRIYHTVQNYGV